MKTLKLLTIILGLSLISLQAKSQSKNDYSDTKITLTKFYLIEMGMSLERVQNILGEGELVSSSYFANIQTEMWVWKNRNGSNMNAMFQNDKLVSKAQYKLQ